MMWAQERRSAPRAHPCRTRAARTRPDITLRTLGLGLVAVALLAPAPGRADAFGDRQILRAMGELEAGRDAAALELFKGALAKQGQGDMAMQARFLAAQAALNLGENDEALRLLAGLDRSMSEIADFVWGKTARAHRQAHRWRDALAVWLRLARTYPYSPLIREARYGVADAYFALGQLGSAQAAYEQALREFPRTDYAAAARYNLARLAEEQRRFADAAAAYNALAYLDNSDAFSELARARLDALVAAKRAAPPSFNHHLARVDRLLNARALEDATRALKALEALVVTTTQRATYEYRAAKLAFRNRDYDAAVAAFTKLATATSGWKQLEYKSWIARCYSAADDAVQAVRVYRELAESMSGSSEGREALYKAAWLAFNGGQYPEAVKLFSEFLQRYPSDRSADEGLWYLAWSTYRMGDLPLAAKALETLRSRWPSSSLLPRTYYWEGRLLTQMAQLEPAQEAYAKTIELAPLDYYGVLAAQRLAELDASTRPVTSNGTPLTFASLAPPDFSDADAGEDSYEPSRDELPLTGLLSGRRSSPLPWGASVFDWTSALGRRVLRLISLDLHQAAADAVTDLPVLGGHDRSAVSYARARLLYSLGDYSAAYRIASTVFKKEIQEPPQGRNRAYLHLAYPDAHARMVEASAREFSISPLLILAIMRQESAFDDRARSWASAHGLMQIIPATATRIAAELRLDSYQGALLTDPHTNVRFGAWYLSQLLQKFHGNAVLAVASYNAGPQSVARWVDGKRALATDEFVEEIPYRETRGYVRRVLSNLAVYSTLYGNGPLRVPESLPASYLDNVDF